MLALRARLNRAIEADPARAATYTDRFRELADALRPLTAQTDSPAAAWWTLTECHHAQGRFRAADAAFDAYLAALRNVYEPSELPDAYAAVARNLIGPDRNGSATVTGLIRLHTFADGAHPADRAWQACLAALVELHAAAPDEHETALCAIVKDRDIRCTPYAKRSAYAVLEQQFPAAHRRPCRIAIGRRETLHPLQPADGAEQVHGDARAGTGDIRPACALRIRPEVREPYQDRPLAPCRPLPPRRQAGDGPGASSAVREHLWKRQPH
jgi:hypothetical protein